MSEYMGTQKHVGMFPIFVMTSLCCLVALAEVCFLLNYHECEIALLRIFSAVMLQKLAEVLQAVTSRGFCFHYGQKRYNYYINYKSWFGKVKSCNVLAKWPHSFYPYQCKTLDVLKQHVQNWWISEFPNPIYSIIRGKCPHIHVSGVKSEYIASVYSSVETVMNGITLNVRGSIKKVSRTLNLYPAITND